MLQRLEHRDDLIDHIDEQYASDQIKYIYYHVGWLYLDLTSRETEYVDEFASHYLNLKIELLPLVEAIQETSDRAVQACFKAYLETQPRSTTASRYFYKRYRSLLLAKLKSAQLQVEAQTERLQREAALILENWTEGESDTLNYLAQLAPASLRSLFPHLIDDHPTRLLSTCRPICPPKQTGVYGSTSFNKPRTEPPRICSIGSGCSIKPIFTALCPPNCWSNWPIVSTRFSLPRMKPSSGRASEMTMFIC
jgi:hypothetical protein